MPNINKSYTWAINTCNAPNIGYSQTYRNQQTINGITYYDCSSFVWYSLINGGFDCVTANNGNTWPFTTASMIPVLLRLGFKEVSITGEWKPGDIVWVTGHTEMVYKGGLASGICMGAHTNNAKLENQVSIGSSSGNPNYVSTTANFSRIFRYGDGDVTGYGYSIYVISALCGNGWRESYINPSLGEFGGGGYGLFQWTGSRRTALETWLTQNGYDLTSGEGQLEFLIYENEWQGEFNGISSLTEFLESNSTDIDMLTEAFMTCWERPGVPALSERIQDAYKAYNFIISNANDSSITDWIKPNRALTESESLNNAVMLYRHLSSGGGGGDPGKKRHRMPLWMKIKYHL